MDDEHTPNATSLDAKAAVHRHRLRTILQSLNEATHAAATQILATAECDKQTERHAELTAEEISKSGERNRALIEALIETTK